MFGGARRKDEAFYGAFREQAELALDASRKLDAMLVDLSGSGRAVAAIGADEKRADAILRHTVRELHSTWITPLDRHQIHELVLALSGVLKLIEATAMRVDLFELRDVRDEARALARHLVEACSRIRRATDLVPHLSKDNADELMHLVGEVHEIEGQADETYRRGLARLFGGGTDPLTVMKWSDFFENLEQAVDLCRDVGRLFEAVVLESA